MRDGGHASPRFLDERSTVVLLCTEGRAANPALLPTA